MSLFYAHAKSRSRKRARVLTFRMKEGAGLYYLKALISCTVTAQMIRDVVFAYAIKQGFS